MVINHQLKSGYKSQGSSLGAYEKSYLLQQEKRKKDDIQTQDLIKRVVEICSSRNPDSASLLHHDQSVNQEICTHETWDKN